MSEKDWYTTSWDYFSLLSGQRMKMIEFYITIEQALFAAFITLICLEQRLCWAEVTASILVSIISIVFCGLDYRTKSMIHACEENRETIEGETLMDRLPKLTIIKEPRLIAPIQNG